MSFTKRCEEVATIIKINTNLPTEIAVICAKYTSEAEQADYFMLQELDIHIRKNLTIYAEMKGSVDMYSGIQKKNNNMQKEARVKINVLWNNSAQLFLHGQVNLCYGEKLQKYKKSIQESYIWLPLFVVPNGCKCLQYYAFLFC